MPKKIPRKGKPEAHDELAGFDIRVNEFGALETTINAEKLNAFLNDKVVDKKISQDDLNKLKGLSEEE